MDDVGCQGASVEFKGKGTGTRGDNRALRGRDDRSKSTFVKEGVLYTGAEAVEQQGDKRGGQSVSAFVAVMTTACRATIGATLGQRDLISPLWAYCNTLETP
jgi:hypothetical protein